MGLKKQERLTFFWSKNQDESSLDATSSGSLSLADTSVQGSAVLGFRRAGSVRGATLGFLPLGFFLVNGEKEMDFRMESRNILMNIL